MSTSYVVNCPCCTPVSCCSCGACCYSSDSTVDVTWVLPTVSHPSGDCSTDYTDSYCQTTENGSSGLIQTDCGRWQSNTNLGNVYTDCGPIFYDGSGSASYVLMIVVANIICGTPLTANLQVQYIRMISYDGGVTYMEAGSQTFNFLASTPAGVCFNPYSVTVDCHGASGSGTVGILGDSTASYGNGSFTLTVKNNKCCKSDGSCVKGNQNADGSCALMLARPVAAPVQTPTPAPTAFKPRDSGTRSSGTRGGDCGCSRSKA
jgi:hypothetical protein